MRQYGRITGRATNLGMRGRFIVKYRMLRLLPIVAAAVIAQPAAARTMTFRATLGGTAAPTATGSPASGTAVIKADLSAKTISVDLDVAGITLAQLDDALVAKPSGPVWFRIYRSVDDVDPVLSLPYGAAYRATRKGFRVTVRGYDFARGAKLFDTGTSFDEFVNALRGQRMVIDVHTDRFSGGEISGRSMPG